MLTPAPQLRGQVAAAGRGHPADRAATASSAQNAFVTSSRMGAPGYRIQASDATFDDDSSRCSDPVTGQPLLDPRPGEPRQHERLVTAAQRRALPRRPARLLLAGTRHRPERAVVLPPPRPASRHDSVFGTQFFTDWNMYQLLGIHHPPAGTDWDLSLDYLSKRGFGHGTSYLYHREDLFGIPGEHGGACSISGASHDRASTTWASTARHVAARPDYRYRLLWQHREQLPDGFQLTVEVGKISDRNFLQEYYKQEWDELKDQTTDVELKQHHEQHVAGASSPGSGWTISSPRRSGCRGWTTSGWASRCWATTSPGTSTPASATPSSARPTLPRRCRATRPVTLSALGSRRPGQGGHGSSPATRSTARCSSAR